MRTLIVNNHGTVEVDPFDKRGEFERWLASISKSGSIDYNSLCGVSAAHSKAITKYVLDLAAGKNTAKSQKKGARSYVHLVHLRFRLISILRLFEQQTHKFELDFTEDEVLGLFNAMRTGTVLSRKGKPFLDVRSYAKVFCAFWRWHVRVSKQGGMLIPEIVDSLDTSADRKPKWHYFTIQDVERMCNVAPSFEYRVLMMFLFDSGIRSPKELMNVRACDITPVPNTNYQFLQIREETSKTFGRKIKLMLCSDLIKKYMREKHLKSNDFLFTKSPVGYNRVIGKLAHQVLGIGSPHYQKHEGYLQKTLIRGGVTMYDFRHNSVCYYLPIYKSENQIKYRYGWRKADMIHYYTELLGMKDTLSDDDMLVDTTKTQLQQDLDRANQKVAFMEERMVVKEKEMEERIKKLEAGMLQRFANNFVNS
jgi:hypothetical protein